MQPRLIDRQRVGIPFGDPIFVDIDDVDINVRTLLGNHCHRRTANVSGADTTDVFDLWVTIMFNLRHLPNKETEQPHCGGISK